MSDREQMIIGLYSPVPQSGKSEVARELSRFGFIRKGFADALKAMALALFLKLGFTEAEAGHYIGTGEGKETPLPELGGKTPRQAMQTIGTEWGRKLIADDFWVRSVLNDRRPDMLVIDDVRFPNEFDAIRKEGGQVWRVYRPGREAPNNHPSEGLLEGRKFDEEIVNDAGLTELATKVRSALIGP